MLVISASLGPDDKGDMHMTRAIFRPQNLVPPCRKTIALGLAAGALLILAAPPWPGPSSSPGSWMDGKFVPAADPFPMVLRTL